MSGSLKHLGFIPMSTSFAYTEAEKLYKTVRSYAPAFVAPSLEKVEDRVVGALAPVVTRAQDMSDHLLQFADGKVGYVVDTADSTITQGKAGVTSGIKSVQELHQTNMKTFSAAFETYFTYMTKMSDYAVEQLNMKAVHAATAQRVRAARDTLQAALQKAQNAANPDVAVKMAWDAWTTFAKQPAVARLLDTAEPATKMGHDAFNKLHDTLVAAPLYKVIVDGSAGTINYAMSTMPYRLGAQYLYPIVSPVADPAIHTVVQSKVINQVVDYWKPATAAAPAVAAH